MLTLCVVTSISSYRSESNLNWESLQCIKFNYKLVSSTQFRVTWLLLTFESCASHACAPALHAILVVKTTIKCMLLAPSSTSTPRRHGTASATISVAARACFARVFYPELCLREHTVLLLAWHCLALHPHCVQRPQLPRL